jgi:hypothetical protein
MKVRDLGKEKPAAATSHGQSTMEEDSAHLDIPSFVAMPSAPRAAMTQGRRTARGSSSESSPASSADSSPAASPRGILEQGQADLDARCGFPRPSPLKAPLVFWLLQSCERTACTAASALSRSIDARAVGRPSREKVLSVQHWPECAWGLRQNMLLARVGMHKNERAMHRTAWRLKVKDLGFRF